jgi:hypothetical protein
VVETSFESSTEGLSRQQLQKVAFGIPLHLLIALLRPENTYQHTIGSGLDRLPIGGEPRTKETAKQPW